MERPLLIAIQGPTASGKTTASIELAKFFNTEIISCDSRQFFKELKIGAAPPSAQELAEVPHYFIQHITIKTDYNAGAFERDAIKRVEQLFEKHKVLFMVGGSGLYANAVMYGFDDLPKANLQLRVALQNQLEEQGIESLQRLLEEKDPAYFKVVDRDNAHRLIRALEVIEQTGRPFSELRSSTKSQRSFDVLNLVMDLPREVLYERINARVDIMMAEGLEEEARNLLSFRHLQPLNTVGYKELFNFFDGAIMREEAVNLIKQNSRRFAKRQLTWLRRDKNALWINPSNIEEMKSVILNKLKSANQE